jgi:hypothetical protein
MGYTTLVNQPYYKGIMILIGYPTQRIQNPQVNISSYKCVLLDL